MKLPRLMSGCEIWFFSNNDPYHERNGHRARIFRIDRVKRKVRLYFFEDDDKPAEEEFDFVDCWEEEVSLHSFY